MTRTPDTTNLKWPSWRASLGVILLVAAFLYVWILPLFRPRGDFLWGHYRIKDLYLGIPIALATLVILLLVAVPARHRRSLSVRLVTLTVAVLGAFFVCDAAYAFGVMRVWQADFWLDQAHISRRYSVADNELGFVRKPGVSWRGYIAGANRIVDYRTDEQGFRNSPGLRSADIVFIGDSFTEAATVVEEDTFVRRVEKASGLSAINLGRGAYGPQQELIVLNRYGLTYQPRVVIWQLFEGNDLEDAASFAEWKQNRQHVNTSLRERYFTNSLLADWLNNTRKQDTAPFATLRHHNGPPSRVSVRYPYDRGQPSKVPNGMAETLRALEAGYRLCSSRGIKLLVVMIPSMVRVMEPFITFDRAEDKDHYLPSNVISSEKDFSRQVAEFCSQLGCSFIDTFTAQRRAADGDNRSLYISHDEHLDIRGHEVVAETVVEWLNSQQLGSQSQQ